MKIEPVPHFGDPMNARKKPARRAARSRKAASPRTSAPRAAAKPAASARKPATRTRATPKTSDMSKYCARPDLGAPADGYFETKVAQNLRPIAERIREIVKSAVPSARESIKWGMPVYEQDGMLCYIRAQAAYIAFGFYEQGVHLDDPAGLLEGSGENMRHVKVRSLAEIRADMFANWVRRAAQLNAKP